MMKKLFLTTLFTLVLSGSAFALGCNLKADKLQDNGYGGMQFEIYNPNSTTVSISGIRYYDSSGKLLRTYSVTKFAKSKSNLNFLHYTSDNFLKKVSSVSFDCYIYKAQSNNNLSLSNKKKHSNGLIDWFKNRSWWEYILMGLFAFGIISTIIDSNSKDKKSFKEKNNTSPLTSISKEKSSSEKNVFDRFYAGNLDLATAFWLFGVVGTFVVGFLGGLLGEYYSKIFYIPSLIISAGILLNLWGCADYYTKQKTKKKQSAVWGYLAQVYCGVSGLGLIYTAYDVIQTL